jgi:NAD+ synthase (glutamine-hydrolysing)
MRIGLLQINPVVGDLQGNAARIEAAFAQAQAAGADLCLTPELALTGYPPRDMLLYAGFCQAAWAEAQALAARLPALANGAAHPGGPALVLGCPEPNDSGQGKSLFNAALWCEAGTVRQSIRKSLLPTYDVFDEARYFEPGAPSDQKGGASNVVEYRGVKLAVTICEDLWNDKDYWPHRLYPVDPVEAACAAGAEVLLNLSASPFSLRKQVLRRDMLSAIAKKRGLPLAYCNQVGGNDELVFDGRSALYGPDGTTLARAAGFEEQVLVADLAVAGSVSQDDLSSSAEIWQALVLGTRDYLRKCGFKKALLGLSGGIDSAVVVAVAVEALGAQNVLGVLMPSPWSSQGSIDDSLALAKNLGMPTRTIPIEPLMQGFDAALGESFAALAPGQTPGTTEENIQSRIRGNLLMALSNKTGALLLTTGNKSEPRVCRLVKGAEFKRRQAAPGIKIAWRSFGSGWRMPLAAAPLP